MATYPTICPLNQKNECEKEQASQSINNGFDDVDAVRDEELLARVIKKDFHLTDGKLNKQFFPSDDLKIRDGWSFTRVDMINQQQKAERLKEIGLLGKKPNPSNLYGYASVKANFVRIVAKENTGCRDLCVIDDANENQKEHALAQASRKLSPKEIEKMRKKLLREMEKSRCCF